MKSLLLAFCVSLDQTRSIQGFSPIFSPVSPSPFRSRVRPSTARRTHLLPTKSPFKTCLSASETAFQGEDWECGDVYRDLDRLEQAINFANAEQNLKHVERIETLQHLAKSRYPLFPSLVRYVAAPIACALLLRALSRNSKIHTVLLAATKVSDAYFWGVVVGAPIVLLLLKRLNLPAAEPMPSELKGLSPEYLSFVSTTWEPPQESTKDHILFLLEYWVSAIAGTAVMGLIQVVTKWRPHRNNAAIALWWSCAQCLTRVGVIAALYQFPKQLYRLERSEQPRPVGFFPTILCRLVWSLKFFLPLGLAIDFFRLLPFVSPEVVGLLGSTASIFAVGTWIRLQQLAASGTVAKLESLTSQRKLIYALSALTIWRKPLYRLIAVLKSTTPRTIIETFEIAPLLVSLIYLGRGAVGLLPLLGPLIHIFCAKKLFRIVFTHDLSLATDTEAFKAMMEDEAAMAKRMKWRYRLEWRESKRLSVVLGEWQEGWLYWLRFQGSAREKLHLEALENLRESQMRGNRVLDKVKDELESTPDGVEDFVPREQWKIDAMQRIAEQHKQDYESNKFEDPLGVAIYKAFGIGLGFKFDYNRPLEPGEKPTLQRLQARAAKSAMQRARDLYDAEAAAAALANTSSPEERTAKAIELRRKTQEEIQFLAQRLTDLIPTGKQAKSEFESKVIFQEYQERPNYVRTSSHEVLMESPLSPESSAEQLWEDTSTSEIPQESDESDGDDREFIDAYARQQFGRSVNVDDDDDDRDDDTDGTQIVLA